VVYLRVCLAGRGNIVELKAVDVSRTLIPKKNTKTPRNGKKKQKNAKKTHWTVGATRRGRIHAKMSFVLSRKCPREMQLSRSMFGVHNRPRCRTKHSVSSSSSISLILYSPTPPVGRTVPFLFPAVKPETAEHYGPSDGTAIKGRRANLSLCVRLNANSWTPGRKLAGSEQRSGGHDTLRSPINKY